MEIPESIKEQFNIGLENESAAKQAEYQNAAYNIVSRVGYLIGVDKKHFENPDNLSFPEETYSALNANKNARIIRNLCRVRSAFEQSYMAIVNSFNYEFGNISSVPHLIPSDAVNELSSDGVYLYKSKPDVDQYIIAINGEIANRIANCRNIFPEWLNWEHIKSLFIMPNGTKVEGIKEEGAHYNSDRNRYPYQCYINWPADNYGNILFNDEKFVRVLYEVHEELFTDMSLVRAASDAIRHGIHDFLSNAKKAIVVVDCENSNPIKLAGMFHSLTDEMKEHIYKVLLFDSEYTTSGWQVMFEENMIDIKTDYEVVTRLYEDKSQVDMTLAVETTKEVYANGVDSVILVSSDSDYWTLIKHLPDAKFIMMIEQDKSGLKIRDVLERNTIPYCFIDDFNTAVSYSIKTKAIKRYIQKELDSRLNIEMKELVNEAIDHSWVEMTEKEKVQFYNNYVKQMHIAWDKDVVRLELGE